MEPTTNGKDKPQALALLSSNRPRNVSWRQAGGLLFGDWGTSRLYVLGLAFFFAGRTSFYLIAAMSLLILAVGWAYTQICRIYPDGGGVYTAAKHKSQMLAVIGALLLFADYVVTASLSSLDAFHYFGLSHGEGALWSLHSPGLWAMVAIAAIGIFNLLGPRHTGGFAIAAALGMIFITVLITAFALPQVDWRNLPARIGRINEPPTTLWLHFVAIVLALSGVEAIGNLTGVMKRPVAHTARKSIWLVAAEVAIFNVLLCVAMVAVLAPEARAEHKEDMLAFLARTYVGPWGEIAVRAIGGLLLLSACNTVITDMISVQYLMSRDGELPGFFQKLNRFGVPWSAALIATLVPCAVLVVSHDLEHLAALYAIGVVGAVAINITLCSTHPRLRRLRRKVPMLALGLFLLAIWVTLAATKLHALIFVLIVLAAGLSARMLTKWWAARRGERQTLLRKAILEQLPAEALAMPRVLVGTYGSELLAPAALLEARQDGAALVVCFIREVALSYKYDPQQAGFTMESDLAAQRTFGRYLELAHEAGVPIIPVYDAGPNPAELIAETAAVYNCEKVLIGTSRRGAIFHLIKGHFQRKLEAILPPEVQVKVISPVSEQSLLEDASAAGPRSSPSAPKPA